MTGPRPSGGRPGAPPLGRALEHVSVTGVPGTPRGGPARGPGAPGRGALYRRVTLLAGLAFASNGLTLGVLSYALLGLHAAWRLTPAQAGVLTMAAGAGELVGGVAVGYAADRMGRRLGYALTVALTGVANGAAALAPSLGWLVALVFVANCGFGGVAPVATSLVGEFAPREHRGQMMGWTQVIWILGWLVGGAAGVVLAHGVGWREVFAVGALPIVLAVIGPWLLPESPRFLLARGRRREAEALARTLWDRHGVHVELPAQERALPVSVAAHLRELWGPRFRRRSALLWSVWFIMVAAYNGPVIWLATLIAAAGFPHADRAAFFVAAVSVPPVVAATLLLDRVGRKPVIVAGLCLAACGAVVLAAARSEIGLVTGGAAISSGTLAAWPVMLAYAAESYPTRIRATAVGWASAGGRAGGIVAPLALGALIGTWTSGHGLAMAVFAAALGLAVLTVLVLGEETKGRSLEELADAASPAPAAAAPP